MTDLSRNGVPHVVLPAWQDCYENAARAEWLGIGVYGNKSRAPNISAKELSKGLLKVMNNKSYREKASELAKLCHRKEGRVAAAEKILEIAQSRDHGKLAMRLPEMKTNCPLYEVKNRQGMVLQTAQKPTTAGKGDSKYVLIEASPSPSPFALASNYNKANHRSRPLLTDVYETLLMTILSNTWLFFPVLGYSLLLIPRLRLFALVYILYIKFISKAHKTGTLSLRNDRFRHSSIWKTTYANYFPLTLYRTVPLPPQRRYIFGYHPHGIALRGAIGAFAAEAADFSQLFPGITNTLLMKDSFYTTPLLREYLLSLGTSGVSRSSCIRHLTRGGHDDRGMGRAITITVGGSREYNIAKPGTMDVVVKIRKGFVRVAVQTGADLVPVIAFGENELFDRVDVNSSTALGLVARAWEFAVGHRVAFSTGRFGLFCPHRRPLNVVVGKPIEVKQQRWEPDEAYIDEVHAQYVTELGKLYDGWKETFAPNKDVKFEVVE